MTDIRQNMKKVFIKEFDTKLHKEYNHLVVDVYEDIRIIERTQVLDNRYQYVIMNSLNNANEISYDDFLGLLFFCLVFDNTIKGDPLEKWINQRS